MTIELFIAQFLNGVQYGVLLFLLAAGLSLVFGIMNFVNLAHGSLYMLGAYLAAWTYNTSISSGFLGASPAFILAGLAGVVGAMLIGGILERLILSSLYQRDHLDQVLVTFGLILIANETARTIWGPSPYYMQIPPLLSGTIEIFGATYPAYRLLIIVVGLMVAGGLYGLIQHTRIGMLVRAGATHAHIVSALGVNIKALNTFIFMLGAGLAGLAGWMAGPILSVQPGMGEPILIVALVVIVTGGIGSIRGAFWGALVIGIIDTLGRVLFPVILASIFERSLAQAAGPAIASMLIYILMAWVLALRPEGLFPVRQT